MWYNDNPAWRVNPKSGIVYQEMVDDARRNGQPIPEPLLQFPDASWYEAMGRNHWLERYTCRNIEGNPMGCWLNEAEHRDATGDEISTCTSVARDAGNFLHAALPKARPSTKRSKSARPERR